MNFSELYFLSELSNDVCYDVMARSSNVNTWSNFLWLDNNLWKFEFVWHLFLLAWYFFLTAVRIWILNSWVCHKHSSLMHKIHGLRAKMLVWSCELLLWVQMLQVTSQLFVQSIILILWPAWHIPSAFFHWLRFLI